MRRSKDGETDAHCWDGDEWRGALETPSGGRLALLQDELDGLQYLLRRFDGHVVAFEFAREKLGL
jgi:hypothetical protein